MVDSIAKDTTCLSHRAWRRQDGADLEALPILASSHSAGTLLCVLLEGEGDHHSYLSMRPFDVHRDWPVKVLLTGAIVAQTLWE